ncbi:MAG: hypothetical protein KFB94_07860 [Methylophilaceae bacterium]|nr:MAG: hypothetical protein KFB94_07860 [Methylophilaceae bacterium]
MKIKIGSIILLSILIFLTACKGERDKDELISFVQDNKFKGSPIVFMERYGEYLDEWWKVTIYFGYGDNYNWETCLMDAERFNLEVKKDSFRCVLSK